MELSQSQVDNDLPELTVSLPGDSGQNQRLRCREIYFASMSHDSPPPKKWGQKHQQNTKELMPACQSLIAVHSNIQSREYLVFAMINK